MAALEQLFNYNLVTVFLGILIPLLLYCYSTRNFAYWKKRGVPFEKPFPFIGTFAAFFLKDIRQVELDRYQKYGKIYGLYEGNTPVLVVSEPNLVRNILSKDFQFFPSFRLIDMNHPIMDNMLIILQGEDWKRVRSILAPTFTTGKVKKLVNIFQDCSTSVIDYYTESKGAPVDVLNACRSYTVDVIGSATFSTKIDSLRNPKNDFIQNVEAIFEAYTAHLRIALILILPRISKTLNVSFVDGKPLEFFKGIILDIIQERRRTGERRNDFLQLLLDVVDKELKGDICEDKDEDIATNYEYDSTSQQNTKATGSKRLSIDELVSNCVIFFFGGYLSTATTLGLATYLLAVNQDVQDKLFKEIKEVLSETNGELSFEALQKMKYLDGVISETLRLYPPLPMSCRTAAADYKLGDTGITVPKEMVVCIPTYALHNDPKYFPDPEIFNPDRFSPTERSKLTPYTYLPFGGGPRNCVGMRFALIQIKVCLLEVVSKLHVKTCPKTAIPLKFSQAGGVIAPKSLMLSFEQRSDCPLKS